MSEPLRHALRLLLAVALMGVGPGTRVADALLFHSTGAPVSVSHQVDDGSALLPHGDSCVLALPTAPAGTTVACAPALVTAPVLDTPDAPRPQAVPPTRAARPPPSRAPPTLQA
jgi:hypothetical protein